MEDIIILSAISLYQEEVNWCFCNLSNSLLFLLYYQMQFLFLVIKKVIFQTHHPHIGTLNNSITFHYTTVHIHYLGCGAIITVKKNVNNGNIILIMIQLLFFLHVTYILCCIIKSISLPNTLFIVLCLLSPYFYERDYQLYIFKHT